jgi:hypothetical protein
MMTHDPTHSHVLHDRYVGDILGAFCEEKWDALYVCRGFLATFFAVIIPRRSLMIKHVKTNVQPHRQKTMTRGKGSFGGF